MPNYEQEALHWINQARTASAYDDEEGMRKCIALAIQNIKLVKNASLCDIIKELRRELSCLEGEQGRDREGSRLSLAA